MSDIDNHLICSAFQCNELGSYEKTTGRTLCDLHESYILLIRSMLEVQVEVGEITQDEMRQSLLKESRVLAYTSSDHPILEVIDGGKEEGEASLPKGSSRALGRGRDT